MKLNDNYNTTNTQQILALKTSEESVLHTKKTIHSIVLK